ncbi:predicted protein [Nematostella vectensis]|uniref:Protein kinase domain-containing protein n=1 Tax=Nematostella vectensis TaxID=45351 RepID=A7S952_NEMVE|nr:predicted protein [Nematostella vectensis]|eukprot:XP_001631855.1 predicted protein [Nematostella vectensis]
MSTDPSTAVTRLRAPRKFGSSRSLCTTRNSIGERPVPKVKVIGPTTIFRGEFSPSVGFYMVLCEGKRNTSMCLLKHFASNQRVDWAREVEVLMRLHSNGSHANIIQYMWHGQGFCVSDMIVNQLYMTFSQHRLLCYDFRTSTTLTDYLNKTRKTPGLLPQLILAIGSDVINALRHLKLCDVIHNHVVPSNILIEYSTGVPPIKAILGGFGRAVYLNSFKRLNNSKGKDHETDIAQYGHLLRHLLDHSPDTNGHNQIFRVADRCIQEFNRPTVNAVREMLDEAWDECDTWDTVL